MSFFSKYHAS